MVGQPFCGTCPFVWGLLYLNTCVTCQDVVSLTAMLGQQDWYDADFWCSGSRPH